MHPALFTLMRLRATAWRRQIGRDLKTVRGCLFFLFGAVILGFSILPFFLFVVAGATSFHEFYGDFQAAQCVPYISTILLVLCLVSMMFPGEHFTIRFALSEVDFLFPGPFSRRELLTYKIVGTILVVLPTVFVLSLFLLGLPFRWLSVFLGVSLAFVFLYFVGLVVGMLTQSAVVRLPARVRRIVLLPVLIVGGYALWCVAPSFKSGNIQEVIAWAESLFRSFWFRCLLTPFDVFSMAIAAPRIFPDLVFWGGAVLAIDLALFGLILMLDADFYEASAASARKLYARRQRLLRAGGVPVMPLARMARWGIPELPRMHGAGPLAWRHLLTAIRSAPIMLVLLILLSVPLVIAVLVRGVDAGAATEPMMFLLLLMLIQLPLVLRMDFRADLDRMSLLKALPIHPFALVTGQLMAPFLITCVVNLLLAGVALASGGGSHVALPTILIAVPGAMLMCCIENAFFLTFPTHVVRVHMADFQTLGRMYLQGVVRLVAVAVCFSAAAAFGGLVWWLTGYSWPCFFLTASFVLTAEAAASLYFVAWAFIRFDPSLHTPAAV